MKISFKLTLIFAGIIAIILLVTNVFIYYFSERFTRETFASRLKERADIAATEFLERDEQSMPAVLETHRQYLQGLPGEEIRIYDAGDRLKFIDTTSHSQIKPGFLAGVRKKKYATLNEKDGKQSVGIYYLDNQGNFVIVATATDTSGNSGLAFLRRVLLFVFIGGIIIVLIAGILFVREALSPMNHIVEEVNNITARNIHLRVKEGNGKDEIAKLAITFNSMLNRLDNAFTMQKSFVSNASHELRTPLTSIIGNIEVSLSKERENDEYRELLNSIQGEAERMNKLITGLLNLSKTSADDASLLIEKIRTDSLLQEIVEELTQNLPGNRINISYPNLPEDPDKLILNGNRNLLHAAFYNVLDNALKFSHESVNSSLELTGIGFKIIIRDNGIGIPQADLANIFQTFYRSPNARSFPGSGIGLALTEKIISLHNGSISISSEENNGTEVCIILPYGQS